MEPLGEKVLTRAACDWRHSSRLGHSVQHPVRELRRWRNTSSSERVCVMHVSTSAELGKESSALKADDFSASLEVASLETGPSKDSPTGEGDGEPSSL